MALREFQFFLDQPLSYENAVSIASGSELADKDITDLLLDESQYKLYSIPDGDIDGIQDTFNLPEAVAALAVYKNGQIQLSTQYTMPTTSSFQMNVVPDASSWLQVRYLPATGQISGHDGRLSNSYVSATDTLTRSEVIDKFIIVDSSGGPVTLTLPTMLASDNGVRTMIKRKGANDVVVVAGSGDTLGCLSSQTIDGDRGVLDLHYVREIKDWFLKGVAVSASVGDALTPVPSAVAPLYAYNEED